MKRILILLTVGLSFTLPAIGQVKIDTLFYDKDWKGMENKIFATYFRILSESEDSNFSKPYRDYYITGELQAEGEYITIDKYDDSKSIFDGAYTTYYKSGEIKEKGTFIKGAYDGEYTKYNENGLVLMHAYFKENKLHGLYTEFSEDGKSCVQIEYSNGEPLYDYYVISNQDGFCSKIRFSDKQPIYESPSLGEKQVEYKDGNAWPYYNKNGIMIGLTNKEVRDYGKYFQIPIIITNNSMYPIEFDPINITATLTDEAGNKRNLKVLTAAEYMKKVRRTQNWLIILFGVSEGMAASNAGYSNSTTNTSYYGYSSGYDYTPSYNSGGYTYNTYSTTTSYNGAAAYQAQVLSNNRIETYTDALLSERDAKDEGYLKKTTIYSGETISGYINIERKPGVSMTVNVDINGAIYAFPWNISK